MESQDPLVSTRNLERLASIQQQVSRRYFRLLEAERDLRERAKSTPKSFGRMLAETIEIDRQRVGRELHTGVGQSLAGIRVHVGIIEAELPDPPPPVRKSLDRILTLADTALDQVRGVSRELYVPAWQTMPLAQALRKLWDYSGISETFASTLDVQELSSEPVPEVRRALYLVAQEGISNILQHANATQARLSLAETDGRVTLAVEDNGAGFAAPPPASSGIGLRSMRDLAHELGGAFEARSGPQGARIEISFPVTQ